MPIIDRGDGARIEYSVPDEIYTRIPNHFYTALAGELFSVFGWEGSRWMFYPKKDPGYSDLASSSAGWVMAFKATCRKLKMAWLIEYYDSLPWYDSDVFDGIMEQEIRERFIQKKDDGPNDYFRHLMSIEENFERRNPREAEKIQDEGMETVSAKSVP